METMKHGVLVLWFGSLAAMFLGEGDIAGTGRLVFWGTAAAHLLEYAWKRSLFLEVGGDQTGHFLQTMVYGLFYWKPIEDRRRGR